MSCGNKYITTFVAIVLLIAGFALIFGKKIEGYGGPIRSWQRLSRKEKECADKEWLRVLHYQNPQDPGRAQGLYQAAKMVSYYNPYSKTSPNQHFPSYHNLNKVKRYMPVRK